MEDGDDAGGAMSVTEETLHEGVDDTVGLQKRLTVLADSSPNASEGDRRRLRDLAAVLDGGDGAQGWEGVDLRRMFDAAAIAADQAKAGSGTDWLRWIELIRNLLILVPVLWTWFGISRASSAYQETLTANPNLAPQPFLLLWQRGFYGRLDWLPFSSMAFVDAMLVVVIIVLTFALHTWATSRELTRERSLEAALGNFESLLADVALHLAGRDGARSRQFLDEFGRIGQGLLQQLDVERERIDKLAEQRDQQLTDLAAFAQNLVQGTNGMVEASQRFSGLYQELTESMRLLSGSVTAMATGQAELLDAGRRLGGEMGTVVAEQRTLAGSLREALDGVATAASGLRRVAAAITAAAEQLGAMMPEALRGIQQGVRQMLQAAEGTGTSADGLSQAVGQLGAAVAGAASSQVALVEAERGTSNQLATLASQQQAMAATLGQAVPALTTASQESTAAVARLEERSRQGQEAQATYLTELARQRDAQQRRDGELVAAYQAFLDRLAAEQGVRDTVGEQLITAQREFLQGLAGERRAQEEMTRTVAEASITVERKLLSLHDEAITLNGLAISLDDLARTLPAFVQEFQAATNDMLSRHLTTAQQLTGVGVSAQTGTEAISTLIDSLQREASRLVGQCATLADALAGLQSAAQRPRSSFGADGNPPRPAS